MSGLMSRGVILAVSRLSNFAILVLSPLLLVRILDIESYGSYQEFMVYATLFVMICGFGIDSSLAYFLPRYPNLERQFVSQNSALVLIFSSACLSVFLVAHDLFLKIASYDFTLPLAAYVFCYVNLNWPEFYWIAKRRTDLVLYYSAGRLIARVAVLLVVAYVTRDVMTIIWSLVCVEAVRLIVVAIYMLRADLLVLAPDWDRIKEQIQFVSPIGLAGLLQQTSRNIGKLFVGSVLGPIALAYYAVASYMLPIVRVVRSSIADVVFPELVRAGNNPQAALRLWQRSNIVFCFLLFPPFVLLTHYAELFVTTLFTDEYLPAVPVLQVYALWLLRRCFTMDVLLRTRGKSGFMLTGTVLSTAINVILMIAMYQWLGLIGPAIAYVIAEFALEGYYAFLVSKEFKLSFATIIDWHSVWRVTAGCLAGIPVLIAGAYLPGPELITAALSSLAFVAISWLVAYHLGVTDIGRVTSFVLSTILRRRRPVQ